MRDAEIFLIDHPLNGDKVIINNVCYIMGSISKVTDSRRIYIQLQDPNNLIKNYPLHEVLEILFNELNQK
jgi:hypothetical protein